MCFNYILIAPNMRMHIVPNCPHFILNVLISFIMSLINCSRCLITQMLRLTAPLTTATNISLATRDRRLRTWARAHTRHWLYGWQNLPWYSTIFGGFWALFNASVTHIWFKRCFHLQKRSLDVAVNSRYVPSGQKTFSFGQKRPLQTIWLWKHTIYLNI